MKLYRDAGYEDINDRPGTAEMAPVVPVDAVELPWCAEHDAPMDQYLVGPYCGWGGVAECRLESPARHYVIGSER